MGAEEAVYTAAVARDEVRNSLNRMEYHMSRGKAGLRGVTREQNYLNALGRQASKLGAGTAGGVNVGAKTGLGTRARAALLAQANGRTDTAGRLKSSLLAEFSQDTMSGAREWTYDGEQTWVWTANASACPACLDNHGKIYKGPFTPEHPSCLCFPQEGTDAAANGVRPLTGREITGTLTDSNNPAFAAVGQALRTGKVTIDQAAAGAARRSAKGARRWKATLDDQAERAAALGGEAPPAPAAAPAPEAAVLDDAATIVDDVPTVAEVAKLEEEVTEAINWLKSMKDSGTAIKYSAKRHEQTLIRAQHILNRAVTSPKFKGQLDEVMRSLNQFKTLSDTNKGGRTKWAGRFSHRGTLQRGPDGTLDFSPGAQRTMFRKIELQMRTTDWQKLDDWNAAVVDWNTRAKATHLKIQEARGEARRRLGPGASRVAIDDAVPQGIWDELDGLKRTKPSKQAQGLNIDRPAQEVAEVLLHEATHAVDEAAGWAYSEKVVADGIQEQFRFLASQDDKWASAYKYGAERGMGFGKGHETFAEVVRFYHHGTGVMTADGVAPQSATAWRAAHPKMAKWVEDNVL
jgi:hypothetical protein